MFKSITIPDSVTSIGNNAFKDTKLKTVYLSENNSLIPKPSFGQNVNFYGSKNVIVELTTV